MDDNITMQPSSVKVEWDTEINKPTKSIIYQLDFKGQRYYENYFDLPDFDATNVKFTFYNNTGAVTELSHI